MQTVWEAGEEFLVPRTWGRGWSPWEPSKEGLSDLPVSPPGAPPLSLTPDSLKMSLHLSNALGEAGVLSWNLLEEDARSFQLPDSGGRGQAFSSEAAIMLWLTLHCSLP